MKWLSTAFSKVTGAFHAITTAFQGRSTLFAVFFALTAFLLAMLGKLTDQYVHCMFAIQGYVLGHSIKEDYFKTGPDCNVPIAPDIH